MVGCILHKAIHNVVAFWAHCLIEDGGDCQIQEWSQAHPLFSSLLVAVFQCGERITVHVDCTLKELMGGNGVIGECFEFWEFFKGEIDFGCCSIVLDVLYLIVY